MASSRFTTRIVAQSWLMLGMDRKQTGSQIDRPLVVAGWATFSWFTIKDDRFLESNRSSMLKLGDERFCPWMRPFD